MPEQKRLDIVNEIRELAVDTPDSGFLSKEIRRLFTQSELAEILAHVQATLLPNLNEHINNWRWNCDDESDPDQYFSEFIGALEEYREEFKEQEGAVNKISNALAKVDEIIEEIKSDRPDKPASDDYYSRSSRSNLQDASRSIFDDVDL